MFSPFARTKRPVCCSCNADTLFIHENMDLCLCLNCGVYVANTHNGLTVMPKENDLRDAYFMIDPSACENQSKCVSCKHTRVLSSKTTDKCLCINCRVCIINTHNGMRQSTLREKQDLYDLMARSKFERQNTNLESKKDDCVITITVPRESTITIKQPKKKETEQIGICEMCDEIGRVYDVSYPSVRHGNRIKMLACLTCICREQ